MAERALKSVPLPRDEAPDVHDLPVAMPERREPSPKARRGHRDWKRWSLFALLPVALVLGAIWYVTGGQIMSTDVAGIVKDVDVKDNEHVAAGQVLYRLDARQFQIALDNARANLAQTVLNIQAMKQDYQRMLSDTAAQQAQVA